MRLRFEPDAAKYVEQHIHCAQGVYPTGTDGVPLAVGGGAWTAGASTEIVPVDTITTPFDVVAVVVEAASNVTMYEIAIVDSDDNVLGTARFLGNAADHVLVPISTPVIAANSQVKAILNGATNASTATVSLHYRTH